MPLLAALVLGSCLALQDLEATLGKTNAQIIAMGRSKWYGFYTGKMGDSTVGMTSAESLYGDALAWRNNRLGDPRTRRLRKVLRDVKDDAVGVGYAITGGGTMWNITSSSLYADAEETLYAVLTKRGQAPKRVVSDATKALDRVALAYAKTKGEPWHSAEGGLILTHLRKDVTVLIGEAKRLPRSGSDALLGFCVKALDAATNAG